DPRAWPGDSSRRVFEPSVTKEAGWRDSSAGEGRRPAASSKGEGYRAATRPSTESRDTGCPLRSHPFHSHMGHELKAPGAPPRVRATRKVSAEPHAGQG